jgi:basic type II keratin
MTHTHTHTHTHPCPCHQHHPLTLIPKQNPQAHGLRDQEAKGPAAGCLSSGSEADFLWISSPSPDSCPTPAPSPGFLSLHSHLHSQLQDLDAECLRRTELETKLKGLQGFLELMRTVYEQVRKHKGRSCLTVAISSQ